MITGFCEHHDSKLSPAYRNTSSLKMPVVSFLENTDLRLQREKLNRGMELRKQRTNANVAVEQGIFTVSKLVSVQTG